MTTSGTQLNSELVAWIRATGEEVDLELDQGSVVLSEEGAPWSPCPPQALPEVGFPAAFSRLFERERAGLRISFERDFAVRVFDANGWLGSAKHHNVDFALSQCAQLVEHNLIDRQRRQPIPIRFSEFMQTGRLGPVEVGMDRHTVERHFGPPEDLMEDRNHP